MIEIVVPWKAFHRAACAISTNEGRPMPINDEYMYKTYNMLDVNDASDADFLIKFNSEKAAMMFLLRWS